MTATPPPVAPPSPHPAAPQKTSGLAVGALILGICGIVPCLGILLGGAGIVLGILALAKNAAGRGLAVGGIIAGLGGIVIGQALFGSSFLPDFSRERELSNKWPACRRHLNGIGIGIAMYGVDYEDAFPANLEMLVAEGSVPWKKLRCPAVDKKIPQKPSAGGNRRCDYFYLPPTGDPADVPRDLLMACDYRGNHCVGRNVLYASGEIKWLMETDFQAELGKPLNAAFAAALRKAEGE